MGPECCFPMPPDSTVAYIIMQVCHFCGIESFISGPLFQYSSLQQAYKTARPEVRPSPPRRCRRHVLGAAGATFCPRRRSRPRPAPGAAGAGHGHFQGGSVSVLATGAGRGQRLLSSPLCTSSSLRPSQQMAPAAATSRALVSVAVVDELLLFSSDFPLFPHNWSLFSQA